MKSRTPELARMPLLMETDVPRELREPPARLKRFVEKFMVFSTERRRERALGRLLRKRTGQIPPKA